MTTPSSGAHRVGAGGLLLEGGRSRLSRTTGEYTRAINPVARRPSLGHLANCELRLRLYKLSDYRTGNRKGKGARNGTEDESDFGRRQL